MSHTSSVCQKIARANPLNAKNYRGRRFTKNRLLGRPDRRNDSGTAATNFRGRAKAKRVHLRKLQRQARRSQRCHA
jgi:hypothetical protein